MRDCMLCDTHARAALHREPKEDVSYKSAFRHRNRLPQSATSLCQKGPELGSTASSWESRCAVRRLSGSGSADNLAFSGESPVEGARLLSCSKCPNDPPGLSRGGGSRRFSTFSRSSSNDKNTCRQNIPCRKCSSQLMNCRASFFALSGLSSKRRTLPRSSRHAARSNP